ncbi:hypothetical protein [Chondromyces apiculatus]|uniref:hypothetical protein n=1 Tax=Chondromyces apiculatus TaxID=51 RepID=UPI001E4C88E6|nr:hypothetical protein [Chondromyces apiculatus]
MIRKVESRDDLATEPRDPWKGCSHFRSHPFEQRMPRRGDTFLIAGGFFCALLSK